MDLEWWAGLPAWARYGVALVPLAIAGVIFVATDRLYFWPIGLGIALLLAAMMVSDKDDLF